MSLVSANSFHSHSFAIHFNLTNTLLVPTLHPFFAIAFRPLVLALASALMHHIWYPACLIHPLAFSAVTVAAASNRMISGYSALCTCFQFRRNHDLTVQ